MPPPVHDVRSCAADVTSGDAPRSPGRPLIARGHLGWTPAAVTRAALREGETVDVLASGGGAVVEHIRSAASEVRVDYLQDHDEWVALLSGGAELDVGGEPVILSPGDWVVLPARVPHAVVRTDAGTTWLAVHLP